VLRLPPCDTLAFGAVSLLMNVIVLVCLRQPPRSSKQSGIVEISRQLGQEQRLLRDIGTRLGRSDWRRAMQPISIGYPWEMRRSFRRRGL